MGNDGTKSDIFESLLPLDGQRILLVTARLL